jgi:hypothetical protein
MMWRYAGPLQGINSIMAEMAMLTHNARQSQQMAENGQKSEGEDCAAPISEMWLREVWR